MDGKTVLQYGVVALAVLIGVSVVASVVSAIVGLVGAVISGIVSLAILAGVVYVAYTAGSWFFGSEETDAIGETDTIGESWSNSSASSDSGDAADSRQDRLRRQYVEGQISEAEFERRIESELASEDGDDIDRELADIDRELERER